MFSLKCTKQATLSNPASPSPTALSSHSTGGQPSLPHFFVSPYNQISPESSAEAAHPHFTLTTCQTSLTPTITQQPIQGRGRSLERQMGG